MNNYLLGEFICFSLDAIQIRNTNHSCQLISKLKQFLFVGVCGTHWMFIIFKLLKTLDGNFFGMSQNVDQKASNVDIFVLVIWKNSVISCVNINIRLSTLQIKSFLRNQNYGNEFSWKKIQNKINILFSLIETYFII